jgi:eukaryotic-like serine/threonine-protein kinase
MDMILNSAVGIDYTQLCKLLAAAEWKQADEETTRVMLAAARREKEGWLDNKSIENYPCEDLNTIDQLWIKYSDGRFGFSTQKHIYQSVGGTRLYEEIIWQAFADRIGWSKNGKWLYYNDITFSTQAPVAHLPSPPIAFLDIFELFFLQTSKHIFYRLEACKM